jgi:hypothetical protein
MHKYGTSSHFGGGIKLKKNRYLLCLLLCGFLLYYGAPRLSILAEGAQGIFSLAWLSFALIVIAGNLTGLLYSPKRDGQKHPAERRPGKKSRSFH